MAKDPEPILLCDGASGIYIPQRFANEIIRESVTGVELEDYFILEDGPEHEFYWDTWADVLDNAVITDPATGHKYYLYQDGDLWLLPEGYDGPIVQG